MNFAEDGFMKKISIITICYNEKDVEKTCQSIVNQSFQDFEWVVIDGGSDQWCLDILEKYKYRMDYFVSEKDNGIYNAMNKGILASHGEYLNFMNAGDCFYNPQVLQKLMDENCLSGEDIIYGKLKIKQKWCLKTYPKKIPFGWLKDHTLPHQSSFIKKDLFMNFGLYNEKYKIVSDWEKWIEFIDMNHCSYRYVPFVIALHSSEGISSIRSDRHCQERAEVLNKYYHLNLSVDDVKNAKTKVYLCKFLYLLKIEQKSDQIKVFLFGFIPILSIKK